MNYNHNVELVLFLKAKFYEKHDQKLHVLEVR